MSLIECYLLLRTVHGSVCSERVLFAVAHVLRVIFLLHLVHIVLCALSECCLLLRAVCRVLSFTAVAAHFVYCRNEMRLRTVYSVSVSGLYCVMCSDLTLFCGRVLYCCAPGSYCVICVRQVDCMCSMCCFDLYSLLSRTAVHRCRTV